MGSNPMPSALINTNDLRMLHTHNIENSDGDRQTFIEKYLFDFPYESYVMIDDSDYHFKTIYHQHLVLTNIEYGFTEADLEKARIILNKKAVL